MGKPRYPNPCQPTYPAAPSVSAESRPVCAAAPCPKAASKRWDLRAERMVLPLPKSRPPSRLGRISTHYKSCGSKLLPQRLSSTAAPPGLPAARSRGKGGTYVYRLPDPQGPKNTPFIPGLQGPIPSPTPVASNFTHPSQLPCVLYVW